MTSTDRLLANAAGYAERSGHDGALTAPPALGVAVVACMDARIDLYALLGLRPGDAHLIRNAGGLITDDAIRSLVISQRYLGTSEVMLVHHTKCGMQGLDDERVAAELEAETGRRPEWRAGGFADAADDVRQSIERIKDSPFIPNKGSVRGFIFDVESGQLSEVVQA